jgi:glycosyltransferase involved in cell wall biosynthesis
VSSERPRYSIVVPVYLNEGTLPAVVKRGAELASRLDGPLELVFVVDGSPDGSLVLLRRLLEDERAFSSQLIALSRNFGAFSAIRAGLAATKGDAVAVMAADLQEPASLVEDILRAVASGEHDVAVGVRVARDDPWRKKTSSSLYWRLYKRFVQREMPEAGVDIFGCTRDVVSRLVALDESHTSLVGLLFWLGFRRVEIPYERAARAEGESTWSLRKRVRYLLDSVFSFTDLPVMLITALGVIGVSLSTAIGLGVFIAWAAGEVSVAGYTPLMLAIAFTGSSMLLGLGIIGSYVWRTYENTKGRPGAVAMTHEQFGGQDG